MVDKVIFHRCSDEEEMEAGRCTEKIWAEENQLVEEERGGRSRGDVKVKYRKKEEGDEKAEKRMRGESGENMRRVKDGGEGWKDPCWSNRISCCQLDETCRFSQVCACTWMWGWKRIKPGWMCVTVKLMKPACVFVCVHDSNSICHLSELELQFL